jgi:hypothetical protein
MQKLRSAVFIASVAIASVLTLPSSGQARHYRSGSPGPAYYSYGSGDYSYGAASRPYEFDRSQFAGPFDGNWSAVAQTTRGHCEPIQFGLRISAGQIHAAGGSYGGNSAELGGRVSPSGRVRVSAVAGPRVAYGTGRLGPYRGGGTWSGRGPSGLCSGFWSAYRS